MGARKMFLHIGTPKTGTTHLQALLWENRAALREHGLQYPGAEWESHFHATMDLQKHEFHGWDDPARTDAWQRLVDEVAAWSGTSIISHELLGDTDVETAQRALEDLSFGEVHLIVTARDLARQIPAVWQEDLKNRHTTRFTEFLQAVLPGPAGCEPAGEMFWQRHDIPQVLARWTHTLPPERVHIVTVPRAGAEPDALWRRFASVIGVPADVVDVSGGEGRNASLSLVEAEVLRRVNAAVDPDVPWPVYSSAVDHLVVEGFGRDRDDRIVVPAESQPAVSALAVQMVESLRRCEHDVVGSLDELLVPPVPVTPARQLDDVSAAEVIDVAVGGMAALIGRMPPPQPSPAGATSQVEVPVPAVAEAPPIGPPVAEGPSAGPRLSLAGRRSMLQAKRKVAGGLLRLRSPSGADDQSPDGR